MRGLAFLTTIIVAFLVGAQTLSAQLQQALPPPLYVRLAGPAGMKVTIYRGGPRGQSFDMPCVVAFRPGYRYRFEISHKPANALVPLTAYPSLDVLGSLRLVGGMRASDHPATILFTEDDLAATGGGGVVAKVVLLERPETAEPVATKSESPLEITVLPNRDPLVEAQQRGRPLAVFYMGERQVSPQELNDCAVPGTVMLPGESVLPPPRDPPCLPWFCYPLVDPRTGLPCPADEICFHDGGDIGLRAGVLADGKLVGLDASDTVAQYVDSRGNLKIAVSNKVCLCVPRYVLLRTIIAPNISTVGTPIGDTRVAHAPAKSEAWIAPVERHQDIALNALVGRQKLSGIVNLQRTEIIGQLQGLFIYSNAEGAGHVTGKCAEPELELADKPLIIIKWPDKCDLQIGDVVTFYIRYKNQGQRPITGIVVSDSLTTRLEYVRNSARSDRDSLFTMTPNEADSVVLRWEITGTLPPGQTGTVTFQARVR